MGKPSIFSSKYEQQMKRRRINIILIILILVSAVFFAGKYYLNKNDINIKLFKRNEPVKQQVKEKTLNNNTDTTKNTPTQKKDNTQNEQLFSYEYKSSKSLIKIEYAIKGNEKQFVKLTGSSTSYDISLDKKYIVFDDAALNDIILADINGNFKNITKQFYKSYSTGQVYQKDAVLKVNPNYIWSLKPHFTNDNRIVYISQLPYFKRQGEFYLWSANLDGSNHRKIGLIGNDFNSIVYDGYDSEGNLRIKSSNNLCYLKKGAYFISK